MPASWLCCHVPQQAGPCGVAGGVAGVVCLLLQQQPQHGYHHCHQSPLDSQGGGQGSSSAGGPVGRSRALPGNQEVLEEGCIA